MCLSGLRARFTFFLASFLNGIFCKLLPPSQTVRSLGQRRDETVSGKIQSISPKTALGDRVPGPRGTLSAARFRFSSRRNGSEHSNLTKPTCTRMWANSHLSLGHKSKGVKYVRIAGGRYFNVCGPRHPLLAGIRGPSAAGSLQSPHPWLSKL